MSFGSAMSSLLWFVAIVALIPLALWLLKRTPVGGAGTAGLLRTVGAMPVSPSQRLLVVEVGRGDARRWLVLGVSGQSIQTLHEMPPQDGAEAPPAPAAAPFAQLLGRLQGKDPGAPR